MIKVNWYCKKQVRRFRKWESRFTAKQRLRAIVLGYGFLFLLCAWLIVREWIYDNELFNH